MNYQISIGTLLIDNLPYNEWQNIKEAKPYELVTVNGIEYRRSEIRCNALSTTKQAMAKNEISAEAYTPLTEFETIKFHVLAGLIGKTPEYIYSHPCPDISGFWKFYRAWSTINLPSDITIRGWLSMKSDTLEGRVSRCKELYDLYSNQKNLANARDLPF